MTAMLTILEIAVLVGVVILLFLGGRRLHELRRGVRLGMREFASAAEEVQAELSDSQSDLVAEALTPDNRAAEFLVADQPDDMKSKLIVWLAQGFGVGRIQFAPGTWGSLLGILWTLLLLWPGSLSFYVLGIIVSSLAAVWVCGRAEKILGEHDPGSVVLDEIVAVPVAVGGYVGLWWWQADALPSVAAVGNWWPALVAAFALFRLFDIWKPWPIRALQKLPRGWGVVVDDLAAGVVSAVVLALGCHAAFVLQLVRG